MTVYFFAICNEAWSSTCTEWYSCVACRWADVLSDSHQVEERTQPCAKIQRTAQGKGQQETQFARSDILWVVPRQFWAVVWWIGRSRTACWLLCCNNCSVLYCLRISSTVYDGNLKCLNDRPSRTTSGPTHFNTFWLLKATGLRESK